MQMAEKIIRKDAPDKVTGQAKYALDYLTQDTVFACAALSDTAYGSLRLVDTQAARRSEGVLTVLTGGEGMPRTGVLLQDRPILASGTVRYAGEPIALVVAQTPEQARRAAALVRWDISPMCPVMDVSEALATDAPILHPDAANYAVLAEDIKPVAGTNIAAEFRIRKGDPSSKWAGCAAVAEERFFLPPSYHAFMEPRTAMAQLRADGTLWILASTQAPFTVRHLAALALDMDDGMIEVEAPYVGGGYGGKSAVQLELMAALAARALPGRRICLTNSQEQDMTMSPGRMGMRAVIRLGADSQGMLLAGEMDFSVDAGAYADIAPNMAKAVAVDCTGPYALDDLACNARCVYTNHTYSTAYRGFGHESCTFCVERTLDVLAEMLGMDKLLLREKNLIAPGSTTPTQVEVTSSNMGDPAACVSRLRALMDWDAGDRIDLGNGIVRAKGVSCLWKTPNPSTDASAGAVITFNDDGSANLQVAVVEMGNGGITRLCRMVSEKLRMPYDRVHAHPMVNTRVMPKYWKTVASLSSYLAGRAVMDAAEDALLQLKQNASLALRVPVEDLEHGQERIYVRHQPKFCLGYQDLALGVVLPDGNAVGREVVGRGSSVMPHIGPLAEDTGKGKTGHSWTVGAQGVEVEWDQKDDTYRLVNAVTVMDVGTVLDQEETCAMVRGGMSMGLSLARSEALLYDGEGFPLTSSLRTYKPMHIGEEPHYAVELIATPQLDAPFGTRSFSEHGIIGMPAALGNALSTASGAHLNALPLTPESIYFALAGKENGQ